MQPPARGSSGLAAWLALLALLLVAALRSPSLSAGLLDDDFVQLAMLDGTFPIERSPFDLYWFSGRNAAEARALVDAGYHPWWTHPQHRVGMLRPFASALVSLEHALSLSSTARHAVSLVSFVLCAWLAWRLLKRVLPARVAGVACLLYALDESHAAPTGWLANRSTLISTALAWLALASYVRAREQSHASLATLRTPLALLLLTFVSGEYGYFVLGYVVAYELMQRAQSERAESSTRALGTVLALAAIVAMAGAALDYGVAYSGFYISPLHDPLRFARAAVMRLPSLCIDLTFGIPARYVDSGIPMRELFLDRRWIDPAGWLALPDYRTVAGMLALPILASVALSVRMLARRAPELSALRWLVLGSALSLLPSAGALPGSRLTCGAALGIAVLIAALLVYGYDALRSATLPRGMRALALLALLPTCALHAFLPAQRAYTEAVGLGVRARAANHWALTADIPKNMTPRTEVWVLSASDFTTGVHVPWVRAEHGLPLIPTYRLLSGASLPHDLVRIDDRTLDVQVLASRGDRAFAGALHRPETAPFHVGDRFELRGLSVEILAVKAGDPKRFRLRSDRSLDDPSIVLLCAEPSGLRRCEMPAVGFALRVPRASVPWGDPNERLPRSLRRL